MDFLTGDIPVLMSPPNSPFCTSGRQKDNGRNRDSGEWKDKTLFKIIASTPSLFSWICIEETRGRSHAERIKLVYYGGNDKCSNTLFSPWDSRAATYERNYREQHAARNYTEFSEYYAAARTARSRR